MIDKIILVIILYILSSMTYLMFNHNKVKKVIDDFMLTKWKTNELSKKMNEMQFIRITLIICILLMPLLKLEDLFKRGNRG